MSTERDAADDRPAGEGPDVARFFLAEPRSATEPAAATAPSVSADTDADTVHAFRVGVAPCLAHAHDFLTGLPVDAEPGALVPTLFFKVDAGDDDPDYEFAEAIPGPAACAGPDGLRSAASRALAGIEREVTRAEAEAEEARWRLTVLRALVAAEAVGSDWSPS